MPKKKIDDSSATYLCKWPIYHDSDRYEVGEQIDLSDTEAAPLLSGGAIEPGPVKPAADPVKPQKKDAKNPKATEPVAVSTEPSTNPPAADAGNATPSTL